MHNHAATNANLMVRKYALLNVTPKEGRSISLGATERPRGAFARGAGREAGT